MRIPPRQLFAACTLAITIFAGTASPVLAGRGTPVRCALGDVDRSEAVVSTDLVTWTYRFRLANHTSHARRVESVWKIGNDARLHASATVPAHDVVRVARSLSSEGRKPPVDLAICRLG